MRIVEWFKRAWAAWGHWNNIAALFEFFGGWRGVLPSAAVAVVSGIIALKADWWWPYASLLATTTFFLAARGIVALRSNGADLSRLQWRWPVVIAPQRSNPQLAEQTPPQSMRQLSPDQTDRKSRALDKLRSQLEKMHPLINMGERLQGGAWNAFRGGAKARLGYTTDVLAFRNAFVTEIAEFGDLRNQRSEYADIVSATQMPDCDTAIRDMGEYLVTCQALFTYLKDDAPHDVFDRFVKSDSDAFGKAVTVFIYWHNSTSVRLASLHRAILS